MRTTPDSLSHESRLSALTMIAFSVAVVVGVGIVGATAPGVTVPSQQAGNNSTVVHENPHTVDEDGNLSAVQDLLGDRFARSLGESSIQLSQGEYDMARQIVDEDSRELLGKYVDVAGETDESGGDGEDIRTFERAQGEQEDYVNDVEEYHTTYQEYREARENGNETRARSLARDLELLSENVSFAGRTLPPLYDNITKDSGENLSEATRAVNETAENVSRIQSEVRAATFTRTELTARASPSTFSFRDPTTIKGRLTAENGTAVRNEPVELRVANRTFRVRTSSEGTFSFDFRPVLLRTDAESMSVRYVPVGDAPYLGSEASVPINVGQTDANVSVTVDPESVRFDDRVTVTGQVSAADTPIPDLRMVVTIDNQRLGTAVTDEGGNFTTTGRLSSDVVPGNQRVTADVAAEDRAIANGSATANVRVSRTETTLTLAASGNESVNVNGTLTTVDGTPVPGQPVVVYVGEQHVATTRTDGSGGYATTVTIPEDSYSGEHPVIRARFSGQGTNLAPVESSARLTAPERRSLPGIREEEFLGATVVLALGIGGLVLLRRIRRRDTNEVTLEPVRPTVSASPSDRSSEPSSSPGPRLLEQARDRAASGDIHGTIQLCYAAVRQQFPHDRADTHWEFYRRFSDRMEKDEREALTELTETYEQAVFANDVDEDAGETALAAAATLTGGDTEREGSLTDE